MPVILNLQVIRKGTKYESYRISLPRDIVQAKGWEKAQFKLGLKDDSIVLKAVKK